MNKKHFALAFVLTGLVVASSAFAYQGNNNETGPYYNEDAHTLLQEALNNNDYDAWISIREQHDLPMNGKMFQVINKDNFDQFVALHNANQAGDFETAQTIKEGLGLGMGRMTRGQGKNRIHN